MHSIESKSRRASYRRVLPPGEFNWHDPNAIV